LCQYDSITDSLKSLKDMIMATSMADTFLQACKSGDLDTVQLILDHNIDINTQGGWGLRRAVRYNHPHVWQRLLEDKNLKVNLLNRYGLSALHTASRFNIPGAIFDLLRHRDIEVNLKSSHGSSPVMVAVKYCSKEALEVLIRDRRVDLDARDSSGRKLEELVGVALSEMKELDKVEILQIIENYRQWRSEEEGRRNSLEEENIDIDGLHRLKVFDKIKELVGELQELHTSERMKLVESQELESQQFMEKLERDVVAFLDKQQEERTVYLSKITQEKFDFDQRQQSELSRLLKKQADETHSLQRPMSRQSELTSPRSFSQSRPSSRRPSLKTHTEIPNSETMSDSSGPSLWEWTVPDEGYCTGKDHELPEMIDCARKELECPICMEIMAPPSRIWQCKVGHVICEECKERVKRQTASNTSICSICKTAPIIGRNLALERVSRSLFVSK